MRVLIVTNMWPSAERPELGSFVRDQLEALRALQDRELELECFAFAPGGYAAAARALRGRYAKQRFDVVHAHFGLTAWPSLVVPADVHALTLHGTDLRHRRSRLITHAALPWIDLVAAASPDLASDVPGYPKRPVEILPCGVATDRFRPLDRQQVRAELGLQTDGRYLLFPADPARVEKRSDRAKAIANRCNAELLTLGSIEPQQVPLWINAANAVVVPISGWLGDTMGRKRFYMMSVGLFTLASLVCGLAPVPPLWPEIRIVSAFALATPAAMVPTPASATSFTQTLARGLTCLRS